MENKVKLPFYYLTLLILAGEAVFILPFVLARVFRPTFLEVFNLTNLQLGYCFSIYGIVALISYLLGGPLADKFKPRILLALALLLTALGGFILATFPSFTVLKVLYGYWGCTTILLFWAAMIKATRIWGGNNRQGKAFGFLDGGRGLVGACFGLLGVVIFSLFITSEITEASLIERKEAFKYVIYVSSIIIIVIAVLVFFFLKDTSEEKVRSFESLKAIKEVLKLPAVWLLMIIILCGYTGYKTTDIISQYANEVMGYDQIKSAQIGTLLLYIRPIVGVTVGFLADITKPSKVLIGGFVMMALGSSFFASGILNDNLTIFFFVGMISTALGVYSIRVLYFAVLKEGNIPLIYTGTAVGIMSLTGYTPDIFAGPMMGYFLDTYPGELGHQFSFGALSIFSVIGGIAAIVFNRISKKQLLKT
jgi:sugar phosphate permease